MEKVLYCMELERDKEMESCDKQMDNSKEKYKNKNTKLFSH